MSRTAEYLHRERRLNSARAFFQKSNVLLFRFTNTAQRGAEANPDPVLRLIVRIFNSRVVEREFCRRDRKLGVTIKPFQTMGREKLFRVPIINLTRHSNTEPAHIKTGDWTNAGFLSKYSFPKAIDAFADASDRAKAGDDDASSTHAATRLAFAST